MKKGLSLIIVLFMLFALLVSCNNDSVDTGEQTSGGAQYSQELADAAADMVYEYNKPGVDNSVSSSFTLPKTVEYEDKTFDITWTAEGGDGHASIVDGDGIVTVVVDPYADKDTEFTVKGNVKGGEFSKDIEFKYLIKSFNIADWKYWSENTKDVVMNIKGVVVAKYPYNEANKNIGVFLQDLDGEHGYFAYRLKCDSKDAADTDLAVGNVIIVNGTTSIYNGFREMGSGCTYTVVLGSDAKPQTAEVKVLSLDEILVEGANITTALDPHQGVIGRISDAKVKSIDWNSNTAETYYEKGAGSVYVTVTKNNVDFKVYLSTSNTLTLDELKAEYDKLAVGYTVDVEGPISWYNEPQIYPCAGGITVKSSEISDAEKIQNEFASVGIPSSVSENTEIKLPVTGAAYPEVNFTWEIRSGSESAKIDGDKLIITVGESPATVVLCSAAKCGSETAEQEFKISVVPANMSEADIVNALYALDKGETLDGSYTLTGVITSVDTEYNDQFKNVTVTIVVGDMKDKPVMCYRLEGDGCDKIKVSDKITVTGSLKRHNDTFEFDAKCKLIKVETGSGDHPADTTSTKTGEPAKLETAKEIIEALYALKDGETIDGSYTLTGKITSVDTPFSTQFNNVTVTIVVDGFADKPVMCYRLEGNGADTVKVGDTITVTGGLKNFKGTYEFNAGCKLDKVVSSSAQPADTTAAPDTEKTEPSAPSTAKEILEAAYALEAGDKLDGTYTLSGTITAVNTPYDAGYDNVTVTIVVDGLDKYPIQCFRMKGKGADTIKKDDKITVTGSIKNYFDTIEFDAGCSLDSIDFISEHVIAKYETPKQIVDALYALGKSETLEGGPYTLTGKIISVDTPFSDQYNNVTVTIVVDNMTDRPVMCYRLTGDGADTIKVGDTITVKGNLTHYYKTESVFEFSAGCTIVK